MNEEEYLKDRLNDQIEWYDRKSQFNQHWYKRLRILEIIAAACIPFLVAYSTDSSYQYAVGALGVLVTLVAGAMSLYRFQELWIEYRTTAETLKHEKYLYMTKTAPYDVQDPFPQLVERIEGLISKEHSRWTKRVLQGVQGSG